MLVDGGHSGAHTVQHGQDRGHRMVCRTQTQEDCWRPYPRLQVAPSRPGLRLLAQRLQDRQCAFSSDRSEVRRGRHRRHKPYKMGQARREGALACHHPCARKPADTTVHQRPCGLDQPDTRVRQHAPAATEDRQRRSRHRPRLRPHAGPVRRDVHGHAQADEGRIETVEVSAAPDGPSGPRQRGEGRQNRQARLQAASKDLESVQRPAGPHRPASERLD